jgi:hypothetical protein
MSDRELPVPVAVVCACIQQHRLRVHALPCNLLPLAHKKRKSVK